MKTDNELIAEFMGVNKLHDSYGVLWDTSQTGKEIYALRSEYLRYNSSWEWLIPVVEKIGYMKENYSVEIGVFYNPVSIRFQECAITGKDGSIIVKYSGLPLIECTYKAVVDFIKWYNSQTQ